MKMLRETKNNNFARKIFVALLTIMLFCCSFSTFANFTQTETANADIFMDYTVKDENFSMKMTANSRKSISLPLDKRTVQNTAGQTIEYYCFKWRDISNLKFTFTGISTSQTKTMKSYKFLLTNIQTDDLTTQVSQSIVGSKFSTLCQGDIANNSFSKFDFNFYIDKNVDITETATRCKGNDFGLYKFDFIYTYEEDQQIISRNIGNAGSGDIFVAILPDDIDSIEQDGTKILYAVSSSNKLMNIFNLYLSTDTYKYVNPKYLEWVVTGTDKNNVNYVYSQQMKDENINYANHKAIWTSPPSSANGTSFIFDSNDIEGVWTANCTIKNSDGTNKSVLAVQNLSTIKIQEKSYLWLIFLIIAIVVIVVVTITLIVLYKKKEKIW